jgi:hypothetical protein
MVNTTTASAAPKIRVREIGASDIGNVTELLARGFRGRSRAFWSKVLERLARHMAPAGFPQYGYLLESDSAPVGVILLIFSRWPGEPGEAVRCNVSSWYVEPAYRGYASFLSARALSHKGVTYLNITPAPHTRPIAQAQGYSQYSTGTFAALPALHLSGVKARVMPFAPQRPVAVTPFEHDLLVEHAQYGCMSLWVATAEGGAPFVFRPRLLKGVVSCAQLIYCRDIESFVRYAGPLGRYLAWRGKPLVFVDANGPIPGLLGKYLDGRMPRFFRGPNRPRLGDLAYTEAAMFGI